MSTDSKYYTNSGKYQSLKNTKKAIRGYEVVEIKDNIQIIKYGSYNFIYAVINKSGKILIPYTSQKLSFLPNSNYILYSGSKINSTGLLDLNNKEILSNKYNTIIFISNFFVVSQYINNWIKDYNIRYGLYSLNGDEIFPIKYNKIEYVVEGVFHLSKFNESIFWFSKSKSVVKTPSGSISLLNNSQVIFIKPNYDNYDYFDEDNVCPSCNLLISVNGNVLSPQNTNAINDFDDTGYAKIYLECNYAGTMSRIRECLIRWDGSLFIRNGNNIIPMPLNFDWVSDFNEGIADTIKDYYYGHINTSFEKLVKIKINNSTEYVKLPDKYSHGIDSDYEFFKVIDKNLMGIYSYKGYEILPPIFNYIEFISDKTIPSIIFRCYLHNQSTIERFISDTYCTGYADLYDTCGNKLSSKSLLNPKHLGFGLFKCDHIENEISDNNSIKKSDKISDKFILYNIFNEEQLNLRFDTLLKFGDNIGCDTPFDFNFKNNIEPYAIFKINKKWGAINSLGKIVLNNISHTFSIKDIPAILTTRIKPILYDAEEYKIPFKHNYETIEYAGEGLFLVSYTSYNHELSTNTLIKTYVNIFNKVIPPVQGNVSEIKNNLFVSYVYQKNKKLEGIFDIYGNLIINYSETEHFEIKESFIIGIKDDSKAIYSLDGKRIVEYGTYPINVDFEYFSKFLILIKVYDHRDVYLGLINMNGETIYKYYEYFYKEFEEFFPGLLKIKGIDVYYIGDINGNLLSQGYDKIEIFKNGLCKVSYNHEYGVINILGKVIVPVKYAYINIFEDENIISTPVGNMTYDGNFITFYDSVEGKTRLVLDKKYDYCGKFNDGYAIVYSNNKAGIINENGNEIFAAICSNIEHLTSTLYKFELNNLWGIFDVFRGIIIPNKFASIEKFKNGFARVLYLPNKERHSEIGYYGVISYYKEIIKPLYSLIRIVDNRKVLLARGSELKIPFKWEGYNLITDSFFPISNNIKYIGIPSGGFIRFNVNGNISKNNDFLDLSEWHWVHLNIESNIEISGGEWGYFDLELNVVIDPIYSDCRNFISGIAAVKNGNLWGFINTQNELVIPYIFEDIIIHTSSKNIEYQGIILKDNTKYLYSIGPNGKVKEIGPYQDSNRFDYD